MKSRHHPPYCWFPALIMVVVADATPLTFHTIVISMLSNIYQNGSRYSDRETDRVIAAGRDTVSFACLLPAHRRPACAGQPQREWDSWMRHHHQSLRAL